MPIQDNLNGALLISVIDFILSFVIIGGIGLILSMFPLLNKFGRQNNESSLVSSSEPSTISGAESLATLPIIPLSTQAVATCGIHPGLTDQQLVVLLTAAACEALDGPVRVGKFRQLASKDWNWTAQGRSDLQSHRLK